MFVHELDLFGADAVRKELTEVGVDVRAGLGDADVLVPEGGAVEELPRAVVVVVPMAVVDLGRRNPPKADGD